MSSVITRTSQSVLGKKMNTKKYLCVYCGASERVDGVYFDAAETLGKRIAENNFNLVYGGGRLGLMGRVSNAVIENGGQVVGITTEQLDQREGVQNGIHELHVVDTMHTRKFKMAERADAFIIMPGGYGTLDEFFEILTWKQINIHQKPIIIVNINNYWDPLVTLYEHIQQTDFAKIDKPNFIHIATSIDEAIDIAQQELA